MEETKSWCISTRFLKLRSSPTPIECLERSVRLPEEPRCSSLMMPISAWTSGEISTSPS
jgi:hypothetical protein